MTYAVLDVREWDIAVDLETGAPLDTETCSIDSSMLNMARQVVKGYPYPGDFALESMEWVTDTALRLWKAYDPNFMFISYAQPGILGGVLDLTRDDWNDLVDRQFQNVDRFIKNTGYTPIIVGLGDMIPLKGYANLSNLDGIGYVRKANRRYAGLFSPSDDDLAKLGDMPGVERVVSKHDFIDLFGAAGSFEHKFPDYLVVAEEGYAFKTMGSSTRIGYKTIARNESIPVYAGLSNARIHSIVDLRDAIIRNASRQRIALILLDGIGVKDFRGRYNLCDNSVYWYTYCQGDDSYLAISTGKHFQYGDYPPGWLDFTDDVESKTCPYDGFIERPVTDSIGNYLRNVLGVTSAAAGSRSTFTHLAAGADICVECCCCGLYNYGTKAVIYKDQA